MQSIKGSNSQTEFTVQKTRMDFSPEIAKELLNALNATNSLVQNWSPELATIKAELKHIKEEVEELERIIKGNGQDSSIQSRIDRMGYQAETNTRELDYVKQKLRKVEEEAIKSADDIKVRCDSFTEKFSKLEGEIEAIIKTGENHKEVVEKTDQEKMALRNKLWLKIIGGIVTIATTAIIAYYSGNNKDSKKEPQAVEQKK